MRSARPSQNASSHLPMILMAAEANGRIENAHHELNSNSILDYVTINMS